MTAPLDEKARDAALVAWFANTAQGWHTAMDAAIRAYLAASPSPSEMEVVAWDRLRDLIGEYFDLGYAEGVVQRDADTMAGDAQRTLTEIEGIISQAQTALAAIRAERDAWRKKANDIDHDMVTEILWSERYAEAREDCDEQRQRAETAEAQALRLTEENKALRKDDQVKSEALAKIDAIRNSIIGFQTVGWSDHIYPLVSALEDAGISGKGYEVMRREIRTMLDAERRAESAEARIKALEKALIPFAAITEVPALGYVTKEMVISARSALKENAL